MNKLGSVIMGRMDDLKALYDSYLVDEKFQHLRDAGRKFVPGAGRLKASLMLIGEAPGKMENAKGIPFVGRAGNNLSLLLEDTKISEDDVFFTNTVKYQPLQQIDRSWSPTEEEIEYSRDYILKEIEIVDPIVIGLCGRTAIHAIFPELSNVFSHHGQLLENRFVPLYHPAVMSYQPARKSTIREGYIKLKAYLDAKAVA